MFGVIGGTGFEKLEGFEILENLDRETPFGLASSYLKRVKIGGTECLYLSRHGEHHEKLPTEVNYRANIFALKRWGAARLIAFSAVGSLEQQCKPGDVAVINQYIDRTKGIRAHTFCGDGIIGHVSLAHPACAALTDVVRTMEPECEHKIHFDKTYVCIEGPYFSTHAESVGYQKLGAQIIGMTQFPEFALAREAGLCYLPVCFVTDYDCWDLSIEHVTQQEVMRTLKENTAKGFRLLEKIVNTDEDNIEDCKCHAGGLKSGLLSPITTLSDTQKKWMSVIY